MTDEIELVSDGEGVAIVGDQSAVEAFVTSAGLSSRKIPTTRLRRLGNRAAVATEAGSTLAEASGRWVKLTKESADAVRKYGLVDTGTPGVQHAMVGRPGQIKQWVQVSSGPSRLAANPAMLAGAAGLVSQLAIEQAMAEVADYLARIEAKVDDVLRAQKDAALAQMIGVGLVLGEAMLVRDEVGRVSEVTWSKVQGSAETIARTQAYAVRQLDALAEKVAKASSIGDLAEETAKARNESAQWLAVLARCAQLLDALGVLELDRVMDDSPEDLEGHRRGLQAARARRRAVLEQATDRLAQRFDDAAVRANAKVLLHPAASPKVVDAGETVRGTVEEFRSHLGIESLGDPVATRRWSDAASDVRATIGRSSAEGIGAARRTGAKGLGNAKAAGGRVVVEAQRRLPRRRASGEVDGD